MINPEHMAAVLREIADDLDRQSPAERGVAHPGPVDMMAAEPPRPRREDETPLLVAVMTIREHVAKAHNLVDEIERRVSPVLTTVPEADYGIPVVQFGSAPLGTDLGDIAGRLDVLLTRLATIASRSEIG